MEETVLCVANSYERKFYLNPEFASLPESIRQELQIMCILHGRCGWNLYGRI